MKKQFMMKLFLNIIFMFFLSNIAYSAEFKDGVTHISQQEFMQKITEENVVVIDVRTEKEYRSAHIEGAINLPHKSILANPSLLEPYFEKDMIFHCHSGVRAKIITDYLIESGLQKNQLKLFHLKGDMRAWRARNLPLVRDK